MGRSLFPPLAKVGRLKFDGGGFIKHHSNSGGVGGWRVCMHVLRLKTWY